MELPGPMYEAATRPQQPALGQPREWFGVIGKNEPRPSMCESKEVAEATRVFYDSHYPSLAPHRVVRMVEQP